MKKIKVMALTLAASVMMMGAGYAYWTDSVTLNTNVTAGTFDVSFDDTQDSLTVPTYAGGEIVYSGDDRGSYSTANVNLTDMYHGAQATVRVSIKNNSTMPVKFDRVTGLSLTPNNLTLTQWAALFSVQQLSASINGTAITTPFVEIPVGESVEVDYQFTALNVAEGATYTASITPQFEQFNAN